MKKVLFVIIMLLFPLQCMAFDIKSEHAILYNLNDNTILYELNSNEKTSIASMTKIMTALIVIENISDLNEEVIITSEMFKTLREQGAATAGFYVGEKVTYYDLLYGLMLPSGAEAAQGLAIKAGGSIDNFVKMMNQKARKLGLKNTSFANPTGLDHKDNYSTVSDIATLLKYALQNDEFKKIFTTKSYITSNKKHTFYATTVRNDIDTSFIIGSKTGFTYDAGLCLASISSYDGVDYLLVTAKAPYNNRTNHIIDAKTIYSYYFDNYEERIIVEKNEPIVSITLEDERKIEYFTNIQEKKYLNKSCKLTKEYIGKTAILKTDIVGEKIGEYIVKCDDEIVYTQEIYLAQNIGKSNKINYVLIISAIGSLCVLGVFITHIILVLRKNKN